MTKRELIETLDELLEKISNSHANILTQIHQQLKPEELKELNGSLDTLRLTIKYLCFDLEATYRERDQLRNTLEDDNIPF